MTPVDETSNQDTLDSLRKIRRQLYSIPGSELSAMGLDDQVKYAEALHQTGLAILKLEWNRVGAGFCAANLTYPD